MSCFRKDLGIPSLIAHIQKLFSKITDPREFDRPSIPLVDHLMSGLAVFGLKCPSLLDYDRKRKSEATEKNLRNLYLVNTPPSDSYLRERLDEVDPNSLRIAFKKLFALFQRGKCLEEFEYLDGYVLLSGDGTGHFSSGKIACPHCCKKETSKGTEYYHQMFGVCVVHPDKRNVIPLCPEAILNQDGSTKNDCERNACKRFLENFRREHPHLKAIFLADGLSSTAPNIRLLEKYNMKYVLGAKEGDHQFLFEQLESNGNVHYHEERTGEVLHQFHFVNGIALNKSSPDVKVNFIEYRQTDAKGRELNFSWVTNITVSTINVMKIMRGARARWKIENETFNTLKNLGYNFEHNYGHGKKYLSTVFCLLMMLAFLIDQIQEICCTLYNKCRAFCHTYRGLWEEMRTLFRRVTMNDWESFYLIISSETALNTT